MSISLYIYIYVYLDTYMYMHMAMFILLSGSFLPIHHTPSLLFFVPWGLGTYYGSSMRSMLKGSDRTVGRKVSCASRLHGGVDLPNRHGWFVVDRLCYSCSTMSYLHTSDSLTASTKPLKACPFSPWHLDIQQQMLTYHQLSMLTIFIHIYICIYCIQLRKHQV